MVITVLKAVFLKSKLKFITYRKFKMFFKKIKSILKNSLRITNISSYHVFERIFLNVLQKHDTIKIKLIRATHVPCHENL